MRPLRSAFVVTLTTAAIAPACTRSPAQPVVEEPHRNPPEPAPVLPHPVNPPAPVCPPRADITVGAACDVEGLECHQPTGGCQPGGFACRGGAWAETPQPTCNPPAPPNER